MKVFCGVVGLILLALLLVFGLVFGLAVLLFSTVRGIVRSFREKPATAAERGVIDGEYSVVSHRDDLISSR